MTFDFEQYHASTNESHKKMAGIEIGSFRCVKCGKCKCIKGRKRVVPGTNKFGYQCAECAAKEEKK